MVCVSEDDLKEDFEVYGICIAGNEELKQCISMCETYNISSEQIAVRWLGYAASNGYDEVTYERLLSLEKELKLDKNIHKDDDEDEDIEMSEIGNDVSRTSHISEKNDEELLLLATYSSPAISRKDTSLLQTPPTAKKISQHQTLQNSPSLVPSLSHLEVSGRYSQRKNSGTVVCSYGDSIMGKKASSHLEVEVKDWSSETDVLTSAYNFMFEKLRDSGEVLDDLIYQLAVQMNISDFTPLRTMSNESLWYVGRICCDSVGRLNAASVLLEGCRETSSGSSVQLDVAKLPKFSIFPGQIVAVKGVNNTGSCLVAEEIINGVILPSPDRALSLGSDELQIRIVCGPFTTTDNLSYEPLMDYLDIVAKDPPHLLFILGPLLDASHPSLQDSSLADQFDSIVSRCLQRIEMALKRIETRVFIIMSQRDICGVPIYPTPPTFLSTHINPESTPGNNGIRILPDPCLLDVNGVALGLTTVDCPMHISREEISFGCGTSDRLTRLSQHTLLQQSFYPIYPPPQDFNVCLERLEMHAKLPVTPHVFVTPSDLKGFIKETNGCVFINPERLAKGTVGGGHCIVNISQNSHQSTSPKISAALIKI